MQPLVDAPGPRADAAAHLIADLVLLQLERARALIDHNPASATFGCADRNYWYYRTLTNFPGATWQQLMLGFACVYRASHPANRHHRDPELARLAGALLSFWAKSQHRDGAFDEWYLNEHSYCPTAITAAGAALTLHLLQDELPESARAAGLAALAKAGAWLEPRYNDEVMNQNLAAAVALQGLATLQPTGRWAAVARAKLERIARDQRAEGWFPEYGGMDFGYSMLALDLLAACCMLGASERAGDMAAKLARFLAQSRGAGCALPGRLGSRGTSHAFIFGALYFAERDPNAAALAEAALAGLRRRLVPRPDSVDDRYFAYFYFPQYALAFLRAGEVVAFRQESTERQGVTDLVDAGLVVLRRPQWSATISRKLGAAIAIETADSPPRYHLGYEIVTTSGKRFSSAAWNAAAGDAPLSSDKAIEATAEFRAVSSELPLPRLMIPFQLVAYALRSSALAGAFQSLVKRRMVAPKESLRLSLRRRIEPQAHGLAIRDELRNLDGTTQMARMQIAPTVAMHSPSARQENGTSAALSEDDARRVVALLNEHKGAVITYTLQPIGVPGEPLDVRIEPCAPDR